MECYCSSPCWCKDCGTATICAGIYYMVEHKIWNQAHGVDDEDQSFDPDLDGLLCIPCLEKRLDYTLDYADFLDCPTNAKVVAEAGSPYDWYDPTLTERMTTGITAEKLMSYLKEMSDYVQSLEEDVEELND